MPSGKYSRGQTAAFASGNYLSRQADETLFTRTHLRGSTVPSNVLFTSYYCILSALYSTYPTLCLYCSRARSRIVSGYKQPELRWAVADLELLPPPYDTSYDTPYENTYICGMSNVHALGIPAC